MTTASRTRMLGVAWACLSGEAAKTRGRLRDHGQVRERRAPLVRQPRLHQRVGRHIPVAKQSRRRSVAKHASGCWRSAFRYAADRAAPPCLRLTNTNNYVCAYITYFSYNMHTMFLRPAGAAARRRPPRCLQVPEGPDGAIHKLLCNTDGVLLSCVHRQFSQSPYAYICTSAAQLAVQRAPSRDHPSIVMMFLCRLPQDACLLLPIAARTPTLVPLTARTLTQRAQLC